MRSRVSVTVAVAIGKSLLPCPAYPCFPILFVRTNHHREEGSPMQSQTDSDLGLREQVALVATGGVSSIELVEHALRRTEAAQRELNAFRVIRAEEALAEAAEADRRIAAGD